MAPPLSHPSLHPSLGFKALGEDTSIASGRARGHFSSEISAEYNVITTGTSKDNSIVPSEYNYSNASGDYNYSTAPGDYNSTASGEYNSSAPGGRKDKTPPAGLLVPYILVHHRGARKPYTPISMSLLTTASVGPQQGFAEVMHDVFEEFDSGQAKQTQWIQDQMRRTGFLADDDGGGGGGGGDVAVGEKEFDECGWEIGYLDQVLRNVRARFRERRRKPRAYSSSSDSDSDSASTSESCGRSRRRKRRRLSASSGSMS